MTLATAAAAQLDAPTGVWIACLAAAIACFVAASYLHLRGGTDSEPQPAPARSAERPPSVYTPPGNVILPPESPGEAQAREDAARRRRWEPVATRLTEGTALLQKLHGSDPDFAAALEPDIEAWLGSTRETLRVRSDLLARFDHRVSHAISRARQDSHRAYPCLEATLTEGTDALHEFLSAAVL